MKSLRRKKWIHFVIVFLSVIIINVIAGVFYTRFDFTVERRFTLSDISKQILHHIPDEVTIEVFLAGNLPAGFKHLKAETADMLSDLKANSGGRLQFSFINPLNGTEEIKQKSLAALTSKGVEPTSLTVRNGSGISQQMIFPAAIVSYGEEEIAVNFLENRMGIAPEEALNNSIQNLEYNFISAISHVISEGKPLVGFTEGHGELTDLELSDAMKSLRRGYLPGRVDLKKIAIHDLQQLKVLVIAKPVSSFTEAEKYKLNAFVRNGGSVLWAIDQLNANLDSLVHSGEQVAFAQQLNIDDLLFKYGVRLNYDLIEDLNCAQLPINVGNGQLKLLPWMFYPIIMPLSDHPVVKDIEGILGEFVGSVDTIAASGIQKEIILSSSPFAKIMAAPAMISLQMIDQLRDLESFKRPTIPIAVVLEGVFPDIFKNRPVPEGIDEEHIEEVLAAKMLVIADGDVFKNQISSKDQSPFPLGYDQYSQHQYGNKAFLMNAIDYLANDSKLIELRQKEIKLRLLNKVKIGNDRVFWQFINVGLPLFILSFAGMIQYFYRKRTYGAKPK